jgi:hypothetical protein
MKKSIRGCLFFLVLLFCSTSLFAQVSPALSSEEANQELALRLMVYTTLEESILFDQKLHPDELAFIESDEWTDTVKAEITPFLTSEQLAFIHQHPNFWKKASKGIGAKFSGLIKSFRTASRLNGFDVALIFVLGKTFEYALPGILLDMGLPGLATVSLVVPVGTAIAAGYSLVKKMIKNQKIKKLYGGKEKFQEFKLVEKSIEDNLNLRKKSTLILPFINSEGHYKGLSINSSLGFKKDFLTYGALKRFLKHHDEKDLISDIKEKKYTSLAKVVSLVTKIYESSNENLKKDFEHQFSFAMIDFLPLKEYSPLVQWTINSAHSKNCADLIQSFHQVPAGSSLNAVARLVEKVTLPFMAQTWSGTKFKFFRKIHDVIIKLRVEANLSTESFWSDTAEEHFVNSLTAVCTN